MNTRWLVRCLVGLAALIPCHAMAQCVNAVPSGQTVSGICITELVADLVTRTPPAVATITIRAHWIAMTGLNNAPPDKYNVILSETMGNSGIPSTDPQIEVGGGTTQGNVVITRPLVPGFEGPPYIFQVQECWNNWLGPATCEPWVLANYTPPPPASCANPTVNFGWLIICPPPSSSSSAAPGGAVTLPPGVYHLSSTPAGNAWHPGLPVALQGGAAHSPVGDRPKPKLGVYVPTTP